MTDIIPGDLYINPSANSTIRIHDGDQWSVILQKNDILQDIKHERDALHKKHPQLAELWKEYRVLKVLLEGPDDD